MAERITVNFKKPVSIKENLISHKRKTDFRSNSSPVNRILYLQRTIGNQAVQRMVRSGALQAKLRIGQPKDKYEQEADRVADPVMQMPNPRVQRQANDTKEKLPTHAKNITPIQTLKVQRQKVEGFGYDFGQVRVHHDETETAHALKARAFTVGQDIVFGSGQYSPRSAEGRKLLAHELTHTILQSK